MSPSLVGSMQQDAYILQITGERSRFEEQYRQTLNRIRQAISYPDGNGNLVFPQEDPTIAEYESRFRERIAQFESAITTRREALKSIEEDYKDFEFDKIPDITQDAYEMQTVNDFKLGCDPEFSVLKNGRSVNLESNYGIRASDPFGFDHGGRVAEIKPNPARSSFRVVRNIRSIITESPIAKKLLMEGARMRAGAVSPDGEDSFGGHVHLDIPYWTPESWTRSRTIDEVSGRRMGGTMTPNPEMKRVVAALDKYTEVLESLDILPMEQARQRRNGTYGRFGDCKVANEANRMEYRTMCSWMHSPVAAMLALTGAKLAGAYPRIVDDILCEPHVANDRRLAKFFASFATKDIDAARVTEKIFEAGLPLREDPRQDMFKSWKSLSMLNRK